jgi:thioredoxin-like negative regulator of GroEL
MSAEPQVANVEPREQSRPPLLFFHSTTDGPSRRVEGFLAQVLQRRRNHEVFQVIRIDVQERPELAERFRVSDCPTLCVVADSRVQVRLARPRGCREIEDLLRPWLRR